MTEFFLGLLMFFLFCIFLGYGLLIEVVNEELKG